METAYEQQIYIKKISDIGEFQKKSGGGHDHS